MSCNGDYIQALQNRVGVRRDYRDLVQEYFDIWMKSKEEKNESRPVHEEQEDG